MSTRRRRAVGGLTCCVLALATLTLIAAQGVVLSCVPWLADQPITWAHFQGPPPHDAALRREAAAIHMTIAWRATYTVSTQDRVNWVGRVSSVTVTNTMDPSRSWVVPGKGTPELLQHEQTHFDLNEVYRRRIEAALHGIAACHGVDQNDAVRRLDAQLHALAEAQLQELEEMQSRYDAETAHGLNDAEQARWEDQVRQWLQSSVLAP